MTALSPRRLAAPAVAVSTAVTLGAGVLIVVRPRRLEISGESMRPALLPGDRVIAWRPFRLREGHVVALRDPRRPDRTMVKRVTGVGSAGVVVHGDNPEASTDSRVFGPVSRDLIVGRVVYRYHPTERAGRVASDHDHRAARRPQVTRPGRNNARR